MEIASGSPRGQAQAPWEDDNYQPQVYRLLGEEGTHYLVRISEDAFLWVHPDGSEIVIPLWLAEVIYRSFRCGCEKCVGGSQ